MEEIPGKNERRDYKRKVRVLVSFFCFQENKVQMEPLNVFYKTGF